jgi:hypothetical protein
MRTSPTRLLASAFAPPSVLCAPPNDPLAGRTGRLVSLQQAQDSGSPAPLALPPGFLCASPNGAMRRSGRLVCPRLCSGLRPATLGLGSPLRRNALLLALGATAQPTLVVAAAIQFYLSSQIITSSPARFALGEEVSAQLRSSITPSRIARPPSALSVSKNIASPAAVFSRAIIRTVISDGISTIAAKRL